MLIFIAATKTAWTTAAETMVAESKLVAADGSTAFALHFIVVRQSHGLRVLWKFL